MIHFYPYIVSAQTNNLPSILTNKHAQPPFNRGTISLGAHCALKDNRSLRVWLSWALHILLPGRTCCEFNFHASALWWKASVGRTHPVLIALHYISRNSLSSSVSTRSLNFSETCLFSESLTPHHSITFVLRDICLFFLLFFFFWGNSSRHGEKTSWRNHRNAAHLSLIDEWSQGRTGISTERLIIPTRDLRQTFSKRRGLLWGRDILSESAD